MRQIQVALEAYRNDHGEYPQTPVIDGVLRWLGASDYGYNRPLSGPNGYIPGLAPRYIAELPLDPLGDTSIWSGYLYRSDGQHYKLLSHENGPSYIPGPGEPFHDTVRPTWSWMVCSGEPACSTW